MSTGLGKQSEGANLYNRNIHRSTHNDGHRPLVGVQNIIITVDTATQFTIKDGTTFTVYGEDTYTTPASPNTNNNSYPNSTSVTYLEPDVIFELADFQVTIGSTSGFASADATYYVYCSASNDVDASNRGKGVYAATTNAPTWDSQKQGWYHATDGKAIARYVVSSTTITDFMVFDGITQERGYIKHGGLQVSATDDLVIVQPAMDIDGKIIRYMQDVTLDFNGQGAGWYVIYCSETTGAISFQAIGTFSTGSIGNQLDMYTTYDADKRYCETGSLRGFGVVYFDGTNFDYILPIDNIPKTAILCSSNTAQTCTDGAYTRFDYEDITYDLNSEITVGASWAFTPKKSCIVNINATIGFISLSGAADNEYMQLWLYNNTSQVMKLSEFVVINSQARASIQGSYCIGTTNESLLNIRIRTVLGATQTTHAAGVSNYITINEV
jgi:hypothetical protein